MNRNAKAESNDISVFDTNFTSVTRSPSANLSTPGIESLSSKIFRWYYTNNFWLLPPILIMLLVCLLLNATIVITIAFEKRLHKPANAYILSLACADIVIGCIPIVSLVRKRSLREWKLPMFFCYATSFLDMAMADVDLNHMLLMAYDRYSAIMYPLTYSRPNKKFIIALQVFGAYAVALVAWGSPLVVYGFSSILDSCGMEIPRKIRFLLFCLTYFVNYSAVLYLYGRCVWGIWTQFYRVKPLMNKSKPAAVPDRRKVQPKGGDPSKPKASLSAKTNTVSPEFTNDVSADNETATTHVDMTVGPGGEAETLPPVNARPEPSRNQVGTSDQSNNKRRNDLIRSLRNVGVYVGAFSLLIMPYPMSDLISTIKSIISGDLTEDKTQTLYETISRIIAGDVISPIAADRISRKINSESSPIDVTKDIMSILPYVHTNVHPILFILTQREFRTAAKTMCRKLSKFLHR